MIKSPPPKVMYVVPPDDIISSSMDLGSTPIPGLLLSHDRSSSGSSSGRNQFDAPYTVRTADTHLPAASLSYDRNSGADCSDTDIGIDSKSRPVSVGSSSGTAATINTPAVLAVDMQNTGSSNGVRDNRDSVAAAQYFPPHMAAVNNKSSFKLISNNDISNSSEEHDPPLVPRWMPSSRPSMLESEVSPLYAQPGSSNRSTRLVANVFDDSFEYTFPEDKDSVVRTVSNPLSASVAKTRGAAPPDPTPSSSSSAGSSSDSQHKLDFGDLFSSVVPSAVRQQLYRTSSSRRSSSPINSLHVRLPADDSSRGATTAATDESDPGRGISGPSSSPHRLKPLQTGALRPPRLQQLNTPDLEPVLQYIDEAIRKGITNNEFLTKVGR